MKKFLILFAISSLAGCAPEGASLHPIHVSDKYLCIFGCDSICTFDKEIDVYGDKGDLNVETPTTGKGDGVLYSNGDFYYQDDFCTCEGRVNVFSGKFTADCTCDGQVCQTVTYYSQAAKQKCLLSEDCCKENPLLCI